MITIKSESMSCRVRGSGSRLENLRNGRLENLRYEGDAIRTLPESKSKITIMITIKRGN